MSLGETRPLKGGLSLHIFKRKDDALMDPAVALDHAVVSARGGRTDLINVFTETKKFSGLYGGHLLSPVQTHGVVCVNGARACTATFGHHGV